MAVLFVGMGGFIGSCMRFFITRFCTTYLPDFPFGTLLSNIIAGFLIGFIIGIERQSSALSDRLKLFLTTGMLGGLSTFSTFSMETVTAFENGKILLAAGNIILNLGLSLLCVILGLAAAKLIVKGN